VTEREIQVEAVKQLRKLGFVVAVTSDSRKARTRGVADLYVNLYGNLWLAADAKTKTGKLTSEQKVAEQDGRLQIFREVDYFVGHCEGVRKAMRLIYAKCA